MTAQMLQEEEFTGQLNLAVWRKILRFARPYWKLMIALAVLGVFTASMEVAFGLVTRWMIDDVATHGPGANLWAAGVTYFVLVALFASTIFSFICVAGKISTHLAHDLRKAGFAHLQELSFSYFDRHPVGWLVTRLTSDSDRLSRIITWGTLDLFWGSCMLIGLAGTMLVLHWQLALLVLAVLPVMIVLGMWFQKRLLKTSRKVRKCNSNITAAFNEGIMGVRTSKTLVREDDNLEEFRRLTDEMYGHSIRNAILSSMYMPVMLGIASVGAAVALWRGGVEVMSGLPGAMSVGTLFLFISFSRQFFFPIEELTRFFTDLQAGQAAAERVSGLLETTPDIQDSSDVRAAMARTAEADSLDTGLAPDGYPDRIGEITFRDVTFAYVPGRNVLEGFNLTVCPGDTIALVGPTGGGKTTITSVLCRFYEPTSGEVLIDGVDYRRRSLSWLQSQLGIVLQSPHLFSGTVRENIRYGRLDATDEEVERAAELVDADGFIQDMAGGYDAEVGEGGNKLSTGQKQLISFARAILSEPQIFIMDEATSSVDTETEQAIQAALQEVMAGRISFVIAHRLSTIRRADRILVVDGGQVIEQGTHRELIAARGHYYELYTNQFTMERGEEILSGH